MASHEVYQITCICGKQTETCELQFRCAKCGVESLICWKEPSKQPPSKALPTCLKLTA